MAGRKSKGAEGMSGLLDELETAQGTPDDGADDGNALVADAVARICWGVECGKGSVTLFEKTWQGLVAAVAEGRTAEVHYIRERFQEAVQKRIHLLHHTQTQARFMRDRGIPGVPDPEVLAPQVAGMEQFKSRVLDPWQTPEDLEDLAARDFPLTTADLDRIGPQFRPSPSWYAEEGKPF